MEVAMDFTLHLVADFDEVWLPASFDAPRMRKLETFLGCFPGVVLTLLSAQSLPIALERLERHSDVLPDHWVTRNGKAMHHRNRHGSWVEDLEFPNWLAWPREPAQTEELAPRETWGTSAYLSGKERATAIEFLEAQWEEPRLLAVAATPWKDWGLLQSAHFPIVVGPMSQEGRLARGFHLAAGQGLAAGILGALLTLCPPSQVEEPKPVAPHQARPFSDSRASALRNQSFPIRQDPAVPGRRS
jgi:hypothetical protein